mmetsp:Transcript_5452/g.16206  ORF Transcript_5452/g.16206 Transcript_5452/m.16206 type:complete len:213 (+) Transcript_5452:476-1114(+)
MLQGQRRHRQPRPSGGRVAKEASNVRIVERAGLYPDFRVRRVVAITEAQPDLTASRHVRADVVMVNLATNPHIGVGCATVVLVVHQHSEAAPRKVRPVRGVRPDHEPLAVAMLLEAGAGHHAAPRAGAETRGDGAAAEDVSQGRDALHRVLQRLVALVLARLVKRAEDQCHLREVPAIQRGLAVAARRERLARGPRLRRVVPRRPAAVDCHR